MIDRQIDGVRQVTGSVSSDELKPSGLCCNQSQTGTVGSYSGVLQILLRGLTDLTPGSYRSYSGVLQILLRGFTNLTPGSYRSYSRVLQILLRGLANLTPSDSPFSCGFLTILLSILMVIISLELTRVNPDQNIFSIKCGTNIYFIYSIKVWSIIMNRILNLTPGSYRSYSGVQQTLLQGLANLSRV